MSNVLEINVIAKQPEKQTTNVEITLQINKTYVCRNGDRITPFALSTVQGNVFKCWYKELIRCYTIEGKYIGQEEDNNCPRHIVREFISDECEAWLKNIPLEYFNKELNAWRPLSPKKIMDEWYGKDLGQDFYVGYTSGYHVRIKP